MDCAKDAHPAVAARTFQHIHGENPFEQFGPGVTAFMSCGISGGQAQRVAIARGLMLKPKVMLLDEPTSALDAKTSQEFSEWLRELQSDTGFIIVTHDLQFTAITASKGIFMSEGRIVKAGPIQAVLEHIDGGLADGGV